jgi:hypothetical protein
MSFLRRKTYDAIVHFEQLLTRLVVFLQVSADRDYSKFVEGTQHLHTFHEPGEYQIYSSEKSGKTKVIVYDDHEYEGEHQLVTCRQLTIQR